MSFFCFVLYPQNSYEYVPCIIIVDCSSESLVSFSVCLVSPEQLRICSLHNYSRLFVRIIGVVFCLSCILQQLRMCPLHNYSIIILLVLIVPYKQLRMWPLQSEDCLRQSLVSFSACFVHKNSYKYVPCMQKFVCDNGWCRFFACLVTNNC